MGKSCCGGAGPDQEASVPLSGRTVGKREVLFVGMANPGTEDGDADFAIAIFGLEECHAVERDLYPGSLSKAF